MTHFALSMSRTPMDTTEYVNVSNGKTTTTVDRDKPTMTFKETLDMTN